ncbi:2-oxoglutarate dehydrogenase E1 component [Tunturiibacter gelidoferens]|jgi:2-oxoglutarate dehydrogenase E1 component|uniref:oxoglutarate dehydrogenase (succinyl-transferring) n=1 Tax=Tunturiibacter gelidiferens TaxID=3069689 RepID=A0A9X0U535_9BACT|nr:2-oxoglutarate dehydrogenase E1 component [Edaphobacter lichenicola]MBB5330023.1 2-oxoglutarate dehydrogenase E1 component [Edaphobacter lichenicola]
MVTKAGTLTETTPGIEQHERETIFDIFRRWGYLQASLDPLGQYFPPEPFPTPAPEGEVAKEGRGYYCGTIAAEFMHIPSPEQRQWLQERIEQVPQTPDQALILTQLIRADMFEQVIQSRYLGTKRFSLEGITALIPFLDRILAVSAGSGITKAMIAMSHRGRLNVMTNTIGRSPSEIFTKFEDVDPRSTMGGGDVKYHVGATGEYHSPEGKVISLHLASNPSHLEAVDPVVLGRTRAKQERIGKDGNNQVLPLLIHGDAAFAGQGILAETLNMATLHGYNVGGTIHVIVNNLLGFTAIPEESNSSRFSTDIAKRLPIPIFHVNSEDPDAVVRVAAIAAEYRARFQSDIVVDLVGYRKHGHSEVDDPTVTQPRRYAIIKDRPALYQLYAKQIGVDPAAEVQKVQQELLDDQKTATQADHKPQLAHLPAYWDPYKGGELEPQDEVSTGLSAEQINALVISLTSYPNDFHIHPKVKKLFEQRQEMGAGSRLFDYGMAELVAFASLLEAGTPVRLSGQDSQRGTFNQRHAVMVDTETEVRYTPLAHLSRTQGKFEVYNSLLSEAAVLGFEYGFSRDFPETLVLWEAQFGDFANGAQIIIDQFIAASEAKWGLLSGIVLLLPHGYEGQGPEHSSARIERYLQLAANDNIQICQPSNAAQYFHLLRRQALRPWRKPLVVFTPKSMLRHPDASSTLADFAIERFQNVLPDNDVKDPRRLLVCSGKIGHNLRVEREKRKDFSVGIIFLEQMYPWPEDELQSALDQHPDAQEIIWVQEEPANMGAFSYVMPLLRRMAGDRAVLSVKRSASATPATGSAKAHEIEEKTLIDLALGSAV